MKVNYALLFLLICVFIFGIPAKDKNESCITEYSEVQSENATWETQTASVVTSKPSCLDENGTILLRSCRNNSWEPLEPPQCASLQTLHNLKCDDNLITLDRYCALVTLQQHFNDKCPDGFLKYYNYSHFDTSFAYWTPICKIDSVFLFTGSDSNYGKEFQAPYQSMDCFVYDNGVTKPTFCNQSYHQICIRNMNPNTEIQADEPVQAKLKFDQKRGKIVLNIYRPGNVLQKLDNQEAAIYCFTNADEVEIKSVLKTKLIISKKVFHVYQISIKYDHPGEYWCELFDYKQHLVKTNSLIAYKKKKGNEYALRVILKDICRNSEEKVAEGVTITSIPIDCSFITGKTILTFLENIKFKTYFHNVEMVTRVMQIFGKTNLDQDVDVILHISTLRNAHVIGEYFKLRGFLESIPGISVISFRSSDYCMPETTNSTGTTLHWRQTPLSEQTLPNQICLNDKNLPYKRKCLGSFIGGAYWEEFTHNCSHGYGLSENTEKLYNISMNSNVTLDTLVQIESMTHESEHIIPLDVFLIANTLHNVFEFPMSESENLNSSQIIADNMIQSIENIMILNQTILKEAQVELNATDTLLDSIEKLFGEETPLLKDLVLSKLNAGEAFIMVKPKFIVHITKPFISNINGIGILQGEDNQTQFYETQVFSMYMNQTFADLEYLENLELATHIPQDLLDSIAFKNGNTENISVITTIFCNDKLFNSEKDELGIPQSKVISVKIPGFGFYLDEPLPLLFRTNSSHKHSTCAYWQYGEYSPNKTGQWSNLGGQLEVPENLCKNANFTKCYFNHLTHFALLIMNQPLYVNDPDPDETIHEILVDAKNYHMHENVLSIITIVGCTFSLIGILGIFITAICFSRWREKTGTKILLQLSLTIMLEIVVMHVAGAEKLTSKTLFCNIVGICLHYVVLAKSSWMFVSAILQYLRFVKIFQVLPNNLILKAMIFAWGLPLVPVSLVAILLPGTYSVGSQKFCYPSGLGLYLGLFAPVAVIVLCNLIVFILIMKSVFNPNIDVKPRTSYKNSNNQNKLQIYLGILLFFMLGLPWVFGILTEIMKFPMQLIFVYLFCLTATLQGSVIFVFYVLLDNDTRLLWVRFFKRRCKQHGDK